MLTTAAQQYDTRTSDVRSEQPRRAGSVLATVNRIACEVDQLDAAVNELFDRLSLVLSTHPGAGAVKDRDAKCSQPCELAGHLDGVSDRLGLVSARLRDIIDRLEL